MFQPNRPSSGVQDVVMKESAAHCNNRPSSGVQDVVMKESADHCNNRPSSGVQVVVMKESAAHCDALLLFVCSCLRFRLVMWVNQMLLYTCLPFGIVGLFVSLCSVCGCSECFVEAEICCMSVFEE
jgi:hypothetical protein